MKTIELKEIEELYSAYHVNENHSIKNTLNEGTLNKKPAYRTIRGDYYERFLHRMQERDRVFFTKKEHSEEYKG